METSTIWDIGMLLFNVDRVAKGKPSTAGIGGILCNNAGVILKPFLGLMGVRDSNEADVWANKEHLKNEPYRLKVIL